MRNSYTAIIRAVMQARGRDTKFYNDAIKNGRSIKNLYWTTADYAAAKESLEEEGYVVKQLVTANANYTTSGHCERVIRLHITV